VKDDAMLPACWRTTVVLVCGLVFAYFAMPTSSAVAAPPAFLKRGTDLQKVLDTTGELRLAPDIDYRGFRGKPLKVPSRAKILSRWNARLPVLVIEGGVHDVWIEGLDGGGSEEPDIVFTGGMPNRNITIIGGNGGRLGIAGRLKVRLEDDSRIEGMDLAEYGALEVLQGTSGYVRNSVFSHALGYRLGSTIWWEGNEDELSAGNSFFHISSITPQWKSRWHYAGPLLLVGWDCESWNGRAKGDANCFEVAHSPSLISMGLSGGTVYNSAGGALAIIRDVPLVADFSSRPRGGFRDKADVIFEHIGENFHLFRSDFHLVEKGLIGARSGFFGLHLKPIDTSRMSVGPSVQMRNLLQSYSFPPVAESLATGAFAAPMTALSSLSVGVAGAVVADQSALLQDLIDREGVARVPPGVYRLSHSLRIGSPQRIEGLVASAPGEVVLIASGNFPVIQGREFKSLTSDGLAQQSVVLSGLALVGGSHGIYWSAERGNIGPGMKVAASTFESLRFIGQSVAGVAAIGIEGIDSNSWRRVSFEDMPVALLGVGKGGTLGMNYADKQGFMFCSFRNVRDAVWSWDSERPSGGNFWYRSAFEDVGHVSVTRAGYNLIWYASTFNDVRADTAVKMLDNGTTTTGDFYVISSRWSGIGPAILTDTSSWGVGTYLLGSEFRLGQTRLVESKDDAMLLSWGSRVDALPSVRLPGRYLVINTTTNGTKTAFELGTNSASVR
jgi:hypothetical protein